MAAKGEDRKNSLEEFSACASIACMLLSSPGTSVASERGVGRLRNVLTPFRTMLSEGRMEEEVIASHFIGTPWYSIQQLFKELDKLQKELKEKK
jgi:hypothetical protein